MLPMLMVLSACGDGAGREVAAGPTVRDSAGVPIVENGAPRWADGEGWRVVPEPERAMGTLDGPDETRFFQLRRVRLREDGTLLLLDAGNHRLLAFGSDGGLLWSQGRQGEGPGEYTRPSDLLLLAGDTALVSNAGNWRVTLVGPDGELARTLEPARLEGSFRNAPLGEVRPGLLVGSGGATFDSDQVTNGRLERRPERFLLMDLAGEITDTLPALPGREMWMIAGGGTIAVWSVPFSRSALVTAGSGVTVGGVTEYPRWQVWDGEGRLVRIIELSLDPRPVDSDDWERAREAQIPEGLDSGQRAAMRETYASMPQAESWPVFSQLLLDDRGHLWVQRYAAPWEEDEPRSWWVFDPQGELLGPVETPAGFTLDQVRGDRLVGRWEDALGVEQARVYRLEGRFGG